MTRLFSLVFVVVWFGVLQSSILGLYTSKDDVILADESNFKALVLESPKHTIVEFFAPWCGHCKNLAPEYKKAATNLKGLVDVVAVDCDSQTGRSLAGQYGIQGFPTIKFFPADSKVPEDYTGPRTAAGIANWALSKLQNKHIRKVTDKTVDNVLKEKLPKALLFTSKKESTNLYKALSYEFKGRMLLGEVHESQSETVKKYGVEKFPTLVVVKDDEAQTVVRYDGDLKYSSLSAFLSQHALPPSAKKASGKSGSGSSKKAPTPTPKPEEPPTLHELQKQAEWEEKCVQAGGLCVVAFLPPVEEDEETRTKSIAVLEELVAKQTKNTFKFFWVDGRKEAAFREGFGLSQDLPVLMVINPAKKRYAPFMGAFTVEAISEFTERILMGSKKTAGLDKLPSLSE